MEVEGEVSRADGQHNLEVEKGVIWADRQNNGDGKRGVISQTDKIMAVVGGVSGPDRQHNGCT